MYGKAPVAWETGLSRVKGEAPAAIHSRTPSKATALRRSHEADVGATRIVRVHEHCLLAGVADATRWRRHAMICHPARRGVHAARAVQHLERPGPAAGDCDGQP